MAKIIPVHLNNREFAAWNIVKKYLHEKKIIGVPTDYAASKYLFRTAIQTVFEAISKELTINSKQNVEASKVETR